MEDPTHISSRQEKQVKKYVKDYFDKAVVKRREFEKKKAERKGKEGGSIEPFFPAPDADTKQEEESDGDQGMDMSDEDVEKEEQTSLTPMTPMDQVSNGDGLKRKRGAEAESNGISMEGSEETPIKRPRSASPPPPPPPPPPAEGMPSTPASETELLDDIGNDPDDVEYFQNSDGTVNGRALIQDEVMGDRDSPPQQLPTQMSHTVQKGIGRVHEIHSSLSSVDVESPATPGGFRKDGIHERDLTFTGMESEQSLQFAVHSGT